MYRVVISCAIHLRIKEDAYNQGRCKKESQTRYIPDRSQGPPNPGFMVKKVQKNDFLKKQPSRELKNYFCFRFL